MQDLFTSFIFFVGINSVVASLSSFVFTDPVSGLSVNLQGLATNTNGYQISFTDTSGFDCNGVQTYACQSGTYYLTSLSASDITIISANITQFVFTFGGGEGGCAADPTPHVNPREIQVTIYSGPGFPNTPTVVGNPMEDPFLLCLYEFVFETSQPIAINLSSTTTTSSSLNSTTISSLTSSLTSTATTSSTNSATTGTLTTSSGLSSTTTSTSTTGLPLVATLIYTTCFEISFFCCPACSSYEVSCPDTISSPCTFNNGKNVSLPVGTSVIPSSTGEFSVGDFTVNVTQDGCITSLFNSVHLNSKSFATVSYTTCSQEGSCSYSAACAIYACAPSCTISTTTSTTTTTSTSTTRTPVNIANTVKPHILLICVMLWVGVSFW